MTNIGKAKLIAASSVKSRRVSWLWPNRFPFGKFSLIGGDPDLGKTMLMTDITSRITRGRAWPDGATACDIGSVIILSGEDGREDTLRPRLDAAEADVERVHFLAGVEWYNDDDHESTIDQFSLSRDLRSLEDAIRDLGDCRALFIDPIAGFMGDGVDSHKNADVRRAIVPLAEMAERQNVAIIGIHHLNKGMGNQPAIYRLSGSLAFSAAARAVWGVCRDKSDPERRLLLRVKCNLAKPVPGLAYHIVEKDGQPLIAWFDDPVDVDVDDAMGGERDQTHGAVKDAVEWIRETLADGPVTAEEVEALAKQAGHKWRTVTRAKKLAGAFSYREGFEGGASSWYWTLRSEAKDAKESRPSDLASLASFGRSCLPSGSDSPLSEEDTETVNQLLNS